MLMMCQSIGLPPISTIGLGRTVVSSASLLPRPPASITTFMVQCASLAPPYLLHPNGVLGRIVIDRGLSKQCACWILPGGTLVPPSFNGSYQGQVSKTNRQPISTTL